MAGWVSSIGGIMEGSEMMRRVALLFLLVANAFGQKSPVPYALESDGPGPTFTSEDVSLSYQGSYSSIRNVDFRNLRVFVPDGAGKPAGSVLLKKGHYKRDESLSHFSMDLDSIYFLGTSPASKASSALVLSYGPLREAVPPREQPPRCSRYPTAILDRCRRSAGILTFKRVSPRTRSTQVRTRL